jgi:hypothetical protein
MYPLRVVTDIHGQAIYDADGEMIKSRATLSDLINKTSKSKQSQLHI